MKLTELTEIQFNALRDNELLKEYYPESPDTFAEIINLTEFSDVPMHSTFWMLENSVKNLYIKKLKNTATLIYPTDIAYDLKSLNFLNTKLVNVVDVSILIP